MSKSSQGSSRWRSGLVVAVSCVALTACGGGGSNSTSTTTTTAPTAATHTATATAGSGGTISPATATVDDGATTSFTVTPNSGYKITNVTGCGGSLTGSTYTTGAVTGDCTVTATFAPAPVTFTNGEAATVVIGQPDFTTSTAATTQNGLDRPFGNPDVLNGVLYLGDFGSDRVLGFNAIPTTNGANADFLLGLPDFTTSTNNTGTGPTTIVNADGKLFVDQFRANRIDVYNTAPTASTSAPNATPAQAPDFSLKASTVGGFAGPESVAVAGGKLVVSDQNHHRVLIWNTIPTADTPPDLVLGQVDFNGISENAGVTATASTMDGPAGLWTDGTRLVVNDARNNRVLIWNSFPTQNDQPADLVLGQTDFTSNMANTGLTTPTAATLRLDAGGAPDGVYAIGDQLFVGDVGNGRVLVWNSWPTTNGQAADVVLGQADFTTVATGPTASTMDCPSGLYVSGTQLIAGDHCDNRYLIFNGK